MNENEILEANEDPAGAEPRDPDPEGIADETADGGTVADGTDGGGTAGEDPVDPEPCPAVPEPCPADPGLFADPVPDADPDPATDPPQSQEGDVNRLREELRQLREELSRKEAFLGRVGAECEEFHTLYPGTSLSSLPDKVWEDVKKGIPVAAAYALALRRRALEEETAERINRSNRERSSGAVGGQSNDFFSPAEVRAMNRDEVRENYQKIMLSMQKWR